ncbi:MAG: hypothetical protein IT383_25685 [Deltaproteobacteria bacterium]|nr:hypothetical protein [Deltaproteobacteria bacterium]
MRTPLLASIALAACAPTPVSAPSRPVAHAPPTTAAAPATPARFTPPPPGERVLVLWTASVQGYVEPCGCTADPLGGVARLAAAVHEARAAYGARLVLLDGGDLLFERAGDSGAADRCQAEARADLLVGTLGRLGLAATTLGPLDEVRGPAFRDARLARAGIPTVGVGLPRALGDGARTSTRMLVDAGGVPVGVTGFTVERAAEVPTARAALAQEVQALVREGARAVVALAQAPRALTRDLTRGLPGLDAVLQGRAPGELPMAPEALRDEDGVGPVLLAAGMQAQHLGALELVLEGRAPGAVLALDDGAERVRARRHLLEVKAASLRSAIGSEPDPARRAFLDVRRATVQRELDELEARAADHASPAGPHLRAWSLPLPRGSAEEATAQAALAAYQASVPALVARCEAEAPCPEVAPGSARYVGVAACAACHAAALAFWSSQAVVRPSKDAQGNVVQRTVGHARAWDTLVAEGKDKDRSCVPCHAVGFGEPGGPCKTTDVVPGGFGGVQCESCHGPGSAHVATALKEHIVRAPTEARCRACHVVPHIATSESFVFEDRRRLILGPGHGLPLGMERAP